MKRVLSLLLVVFLSFALFPGCNSDYSLTEDNTILIDGLPYADYAIRVIINEAYTHHKYTPSDFDKNLVKSVKVIEYPSNVLQLELKLRNPGKENIMKLIEIAEAKPEVDQAYMHQVYNLEIER